MKHLLIGTLLFLGGISGVLLGAGHDELPPQAFLNLARSRSSMQSSFADLRGTVTHLRKNQGGAVYQPIKFVIRFGKQYVDARILLAQKEEHNFRQNIKSRKVEVTDNLGSNDSLLKKFGFRIEDMALSFMDYAVKAELPGETVKTVKCRVLHLLSPEGEPVKVWISSEYLFPLKAEFFAPGGEVKGKPLRSLEITGFKKVNNCYVATDIALFSSDYRTRITFNDCVVLKADDPRAEKEFKKQ